MGNLDRVRFGGVTVDRRTRDMLAEAERLANLEDPSVGKFKLAQGGWSHASASAGTHGGPGAFDMYTAGFSAAQKETIGLALRTVGFASWRRRESQGPWQEHWHGIAMGTDGLPPIAAGQVHSYLHGGNGLKGNGRDTDPRPDHIRDWEDYKKARGPLDDDPPAAQDTQADQSAAEHVPYDIEPGDQLDNRRDADSDGLSDEFERLAGTGSNQADSDQDGLADASETALGTDPTLTDSDQDGVTDGFEVQHQTNPLNPGALQPGGFGSLGLPAASEPAHPGIDPTGLFG